jgi:hypothetical protein
MELLLMVILSAEKILIDLEGMRSHLKLLFKPQRAAINIKTFTSHTILQQGIETF